jgi:hypothetical protein
VSTLNIKKTEVKCSHRINKLEHKSPQARRVVFVEEECPSCGRYGMYHFDWLAFSHLRECTNCGFSEIIEKWELTCSCGKYSKCRAGIIHKTINASS